MKRLRKFEKITLEPGEAKTVEFEIDTNNLGYFTPKGEFKVEAGEFEFLVKDLKQTYVLTE